MFAETLSAADRDLALQCLLAAADGPFFGEFEFLSLMGMSREDVREVAESLRGSQTHPKLANAVGSSLNNLLRFPHRRDAMLSSWIPGGRGAIEQFETRWDNLLDRNDAE
jgi:hypothetical protein